MAGDGRVNSSKFKAKFHTKPHMVPRDQVEELIGHDIGGVCPFGINDGVEVFLDESLKLHETVYPAAGTDHSAVRLSIEELEECCNNPEWVDICKMPEVEKE